MTLSRLLPHSLLKDFVSITYNDVVRRRLVTPFIIFVFFVVSFAVQRTAAHLLPSVSFMIGNYHIHHFYWGIALVALSNWIALISNRQWPRLLAAAMFGIGLGIFADEVGLILTCTSPLTLRCDYHTRITWDVFITIAGILLSVLYLLPALRGFKRLMRHTHRYVHEKINGN